MLGRWRSPFEPSACILEIQSSPSETGRLIDKDKWLSVWVSEAGEGQVSATWVATTNEGANRTVPVVRQAWRSMQEEGSRTSFLNWRSNVFRRCSDWANAMRRVDGLQGISGKPFVATRHEGEVLRILEEDREHDNNSIVDDTIDRPKSYRCR
jgi:hypothetical protein